MPPDLGRDRNPEETLDEILKNSSVLCVVMNFSSRISVSMYGLHRSNSGRRSSNAYTNSGSANTPRAEVVHFQKYNYIYETELVKVLPRVGLTKVESSSRHIDDRHARRERRLGAHEARLIAATRVLLSPCVTAALPCARRARAGFEGWQTQGRHTNALL